LVFLIAKDRNERVNFARMIRLGESIGVPMDQRIHKGEKEMEEG
jgi:hypothetical protein